MDFAPFVKKNCIVSMYERRKEMEISKIDLAILAGVFFILGMVVGGLSLIPNII